MIARSDAGPLIVARPGNPKIVVFGFHPVRSGMKYELTTPLLFANIIRWMAPDAFRSWELTAGTVGTVDVELESEIDPNSIRVQTEDGSRCRSPWKEKRFDSSPALQESCECSPAIANWFTR